MARDHALTFASPRDLVADQPLGRILDAREDFCIIVAAADQFSLVVEHSFGLVRIKIDESNYT
jgi:hypothetical protein